MIRASSASKPISYNCTGLRFGSFRLFFSVVMRDTDINNSMRAFLSFGAYPRIPFKSLVLDVNYIAVLRQLQDSNFCFQSNNIFPSKKTLYHQVKEDFFRRENVTYDTLVIVARALSNCHLTAWFL